MTRTTRLLASATALAAITLLSACKRDAEAPDMAPAVTATVAPSASATIAPPAAETVAPDPLTQHGTFDSKAFAGTYRGGDRTLATMADGMYTLQGPDGEMTGTWTVEADARHVLLDPNSKSAPDLRLEVVSMDELRSDDGSLVLRRGAGQ